MKRYVKLSLLLLIPLFVKNVYAEELIDYNKEFLPQEIIENKYNQEIKLTEEPEINFDNNESDEDIKTGTSEESEKEISKETIIESIDKNYELDLEEKDNLSYDDNSKVKEEIIKLINEKLLENNYNLDILGYKYDIVWDYYENEKVDQYTFILYDIENNELIREKLTIKYNNSENRNEEDENKIDEFLEDRNLTLNKEYNLEEFLETIKENKNLYQNLNEHLTNIFKSSTIDFFIPNKINEHDKLLSSSINEQVILLINGIIYKTIYVENKYITIIEVPSEEEKIAYIEKYLNDKMKQYEYLKDNESISYNYETNSVFIISTNQEKLLGNIKIKDIIKNYNYTLGANSTIYGTDTLELEINENINDFKKILINSVEVNPIYYSVSGNNTRITIKNEFIKSLKQGSYTIEVIFKSGRAKTTFVVSSSPSIPSNPQVNPKPVVTRPSIPSNPVNNITNEDNKEDTNNNVEKEEKDKELEAGQDIDLGEILEVDKDNDNKYVDSEDSEPKLKQGNHFMAILKSRYVPIIIVIVTVLIGGITAYVFLKAKEERIL